MVFIVRQQPPLTRIDAASKVLAAADVWVLREAESIVADAVQQREQILADARAAYEAERQRGYAEGLEQARTEQTARMARLVAGAAGYFSRIEQRVADLVLEAVRGVIAGYGERQAVLALAGRALAEVRSQKQLTLRVHPDNAAYVRDAIGEVTRQFPAIEYVDVVEDARLAPDACAVESDIGIVEASVSGQLAALKAAFEGAFDERG